MTKQQEKYYGYTRMLLLFLLLLTLSTFVYNVYDMFFRKKKSNDDVSTKAAIVFNDLLGVIIYGTLYYWVGLLH